MPSNSSNNISQILICVPVALVDAVLLASLFFAAILMNAGWEGSTSAGYEKLAWIGPILGTGSYCIALWYAFQRKLSTSFKWWFITFGVLFLGIMVVGIIATLHVPRTI